MSVSGSITPRRIFPSILLSGRGLTSGPHILAGPSHQDLRMRPGDRRVVGLRLLRHVGKWPPLGLEVVKLVNAAHQGRAVVAAGNLADIGRNVADREPDAAIVGGVGVGAV